MSGGRGVAAGCYGSGGLVEEIEDEVRELLGAEAALEAADLFARVLAKIS